MSVFDRIRRIKEKHNTWQKAIGRFLCSIVLILNAVLIILWFSPDHIRHPVSKQIHGMLPDAAKAHVEAKVGVSVHGKFNKDGSMMVMSDDEATMLAQQNEDRDILMSSSGVCPGENTINFNKNERDVVFGSSNNNNKKSPFFASTFTDEDDIEGRLSKLGFKNLLQTCSNFEKVRENKRFVIGKMITPGLFRCQFILWSDEQKKIKAKKSGKSSSTVNKNNDNETTTTTSSLLDHHGDCWCSKKFFRNHQHSPSSSSSQQQQQQQFQSFKELKRFANTHNSFLTLNNTIALHAEKIVRVNIPPYCVEAELQRILMRHDKKFAKNINNNKNSNTNTSSSEESSIVVAAAPGSPLGGDAAPPALKSTSSSSSASASVTTITNATLRDVLQQISKVQTRLRKQGLHISKTTQIVPMAKTKSTKDLTIAEVFIHIATTQLHHNFEGKKCLVWSSRKLPIVEVAMYALSGAKHVDAVATQAYKTTVPSMTVYTPPEFVAKLTEYELKKQQAQQQQSSNSNNNNNNNNFYAYGAIISYMTIHELGLGRLGETIDPFADFHAMNEFWHLLQPGSTLVLILPVGADCVDFNNRRVYGRTRLALLLRGWTVDFSVGINEKTMSPRASNVPCDSNSVGEAMIVLRRSVVDWNDKESVEADGIGRIPGLL